MPLIHKTALVTGAGRGLGKAIAERLAQAGCQLALIARNRDELETLAWQLGETYDVKAKAFACDLSDQSALFATARAILAEFNSVDVLINNAGTGSYKPFDEHSVDEHNAIIDVNFKAAVHLTHALLPAMQAQQQGQIINIASDLSTRPLANMAVYAASKFALRGFSLSLMREVKEHGIKVGLLNPGIIDTHFNNGTPGHQSPANALQPTQLAETVYQMLTQPQFQMIDELTIHPQNQDF